MWGKNYSRPDALKEAINRFKSDMARIRQTEQIEYYEAHKPDMARLARARKYVEDAGLVEATTTVWEAIRSYSAWSQRDDFGEQCLPGVIFVGATPPRSYGESQTVTIRSNAVEMRFSFGRHPQSSQKELTLTVDGELVFGFTCADDNYQWPSPTALKPGSWIIPLVKLSEISKLEKERKMRNFLGRFQSDQMKDLDI